MIVQNLPLVRMVINRFPRTTQSMVCAEYDDLFSVGCEGLIRAIDRFDPNKGKLSTFAVPYIRGEILKHLERRCYQGGVKTSREWFWSKKKIWVHELDRPMRDLDNEGFDSHLDYVPSEQNEKVIAEDWIWLDWALGQVTGRQRQIVEQIFVCEADQRSVAKQLGVATGTIARDKKLALKKLRRLAND